MCFICQQTLKKSLISFDHLPSISLKSDRRLPKQGALETSCLLDNGKLGKKRQMRRNLPMLVAINRLKLYQWNESGHAFRIFPYPGTAHSCRHTKSTRISPTFLSIPTLSDGALRGGEVAKKPAKDGFMVK